MDREASGMGDSLATARSTPRHKLAFAAVAGFWAVAWVAVISKFEAEELRGYCRLVAIVTTVSAALWWHPIGKRVMAGWLYVLACLSLMATSSAIGFFRNPRTQHLPDIVQELVPYITEVPLPLTGLLGLGGPDGSNLRVEAISFVEFFMFALLIATVLWCLTQRWRWLALRRWLVVYGTLALIRTFTVLVTTLPDSRPLCMTVTPGTTLLAQLNPLSVLHRAARIAGFAETVTCGDMVYSGHSMLLCLCGMAWHTYYKVLPDTWSVNVVKVAVWAVVGTALFLIVAARLHYVRARPHRCAAA